MSRTAVLSDEAWARTVIAMAIFDRDLYEPTRFALEAIVPRLTPGSLLVFDEFNAREFPREGLTVQEILGFNNVRLFHDARHPRSAWAVWGQ